MCRGTEPEAGQAHALKHRARRPNACVCVCVEKHTTDNAGFCACAQPPLHAAEPAKECAGAPVRPPAPRMALVRGGWGAACPPKTPAAEEPCPARRSTCFAAPAHRCWRSQPGRSHLRLQGLSRGAAAARCPPAPPLRPAPRLEQVRSHWLTSQYERNPSPSVASPVSRVAFLRRVLGRHGSCHPLRIV